MNFLIFAGLISRSLLLGEFIVEIVKVFRQKGGWFFSVLRKNSSSDTKPKPLSEMAEEGIRGVCMFACNDAHFEFLIFPSLQ